MNIITDPKLSLMSSLVNSLQGITSYNNKKKILGLDSQAVTDLKKTVSSSQSALTQISTFGKKLNTLYSSVQKTGNENAISGFKQYVISAASSMNSSGFGNFVKMGETAFKNKESSFFTGLLSSYDYLHASGKGSLGNMMMDEAGQTFNELGIESAKAFSNTATHILDATEKSKNNVAVTTSDTLEKFISAWKDIRSQDIENKDKIAKTNELSKNISAKTNTLDISKVIDELTGKSTK